MILSSQDLVHDRQSALLRTGIKGELLLCIWEARELDGVDDVFFRGTHAEIRHLKFTPAVDVDYECFEPVTVSKEYMYEILLEKGRGSVTILEQPSQRNGGTLVVRVDDSLSPGNDHYRFMVLRKDNEKTVGLR